MFLPGKPLQPILMNYCSLFGPFETHEENEVCDYSSYCCFQNTSFSWQHTKWEKSARVFVPGKPLQPSVM